jgi:hypothetical protein
MLVREVIMGYHDKRINKGLVGETSKIQEELEELLDMESQRPKNKLGMLIELSDMVGAIKAFLARHHPTLSLADLEAMADRTASAFKEGSRA